MKTELLARLRTMGVVLGAALAMSAHAEGNITDGKNIFKRCQACHTVNGENGVGPYLNGVFGRTAGTVKNFEYSKAMIDAGADGLVWTDKTLAEFLQNPKTFIKGTKMSFIGLRRQSDAQNIIAYLQSLN